MVSPTPHVVLFYNATAVVQRRAVSGVLRYANTFGPWHVTLNETHARPSIPKDCRGVLACAPDTDTLARLRRLRLPLVLINLAQFSGEPLQKAQSLPHTQSDPRAFGKEAATFFLSRTARTFVYVGLPESPPWDLEREASFVACLRHAGHEAYVYPRGGKALRRTQEAVHLQQWLSTLPKPLAIFAANDERARQVLTACQIAGISIPFEATLLGVDNDEWLCESTRPRLSSISFNSEESGFEAARILDALMRHRADPSVALPPLVKLIPPSKIIERETTGERIIADPIVARALSFIQLNKGLDIRVTDVAREVGLPAGRTETHFREALNSSVIDEIVRMRMKTVLYLIRETETPFQEIARHCGFTNASSLCRLVKSETGQSPGELRGRK